MYKRTATIVNESGLHARPASDFVQTASRFAADITIRRVGKEEAANAKSIIFLLSLGIGRGTEVEIAANGPDEQEAVDTLAVLIAAGFGEQ